MAPSIVKDLSTRCSIEVFSSTLIIDCTGKRLKNYKNIYQTNNLFVFCNSNFVIQKHQKKNDCLIDKCIAGFIDSNNWTELTQSLVFYIYDTSNDRCECHLAL